jgi:hypothetical protein
MNSTLGFVTQRRCRGAAWSLLLAATASGALAAVMIEIAAAPPPPAASTRTADRADAADQWAAPDPQAGASARYWSQVGQALR